MELKDVVFSLILMAFVTCGFLVIFDPFDGILSFYKGRRGSDDLDSWDITFHNLFSFYMKQENRRTELYVRFRPFPLWKTTIRVWTHSAEKMEECAEKARLIKEDREAQLKDINTKSVVTKL